MGQEIAHSHFDEKDFREFTRRLKQETEQLTEMLEAGLFSEAPLKGGFEIEAWLLDEQLQPAPRNTEFLQQLANPLVTTELAKFNIEFNNTPHRLREGCFSLFEQETTALFAQSRAVARTLGMDILLCGTLPTLKPDSCNLANMSEMKRYKALNRAILDSRQGRPIQLDIQGQEHLALTHHSVMMEAATTSFQVHLQTPWQLAHHYYNASIIASAPLLAVSCNSPFLFGRQLWRETRIPLFEQSVSCSGPQRVSFGSGYAEHSIAECFSENLDAFDVLLPMLFDDETRFRHLRLHNGVIWRWNRPLLGFDEDGAPHIRIEQRVMPAGPTLGDMIANAVFYYGLTHTLMNQLAAQSTERMPFTTAWRNFYAAARYGLDCQLYFSGKEQSIESLMFEHFLPLAEQGLTSLGFESPESQDYLDIIASRVQKKQTGANWQIAHYQRFGDWQKLTRDYLRQQHSNTPVHEWSLE